MTEVKEEEIFDENPESQNPGDQVPENFSNEFNGFQCGLPENGNMQSEVSLEVLRSIEEKFEELKANMATKDDIQSFKQELKKTQEEFKVSLDDFRWELSKYERQIHGEMKKSASCIREYENTMENLTHNLSSSLKGFNRLVSQGNAKLSKFDPKVKTVHKNTQTDTIREDKNTNVQPPVNMVSPVVPASRFSYFPPTMTAMSPWAHPPPPALLRPDQIVQRMPPFYPYQFHPYPGVSQNNLPLSFPQVTSPINTVMPKNSPREEVRNDIEPECDLKAPRKPRNRNRKVPEKKPELSKSTDVVQDAPSAKIPKLTELVILPPPVPPNLNNN